MLEICFAQPPILTLIISHLTFKDLIQVSLTNKQCNQLLLLYNKTSQQLHSLLKKNNVEIVNHLIGKEFASDINLKKIAYLLSISNLKSPGFSLFFKIKILEQEISDTLRKNINAIQTDEFDFHLDSINLHPYVLYFLSQLYLVKSDVEKNKKDFTIALYLITLAIQNKPATPEIIFFAKILANLTLQIKDGISNKNLLSGLDVCGKKVNQILVNLFNDKYNILQRIDAQMMTLILNRIFDLVVDECCEQLYGKHNMLLPKHWKNLFKLIKNFDLMLAFFELETVASLQEENFKQLISAKIDDLVFFISNFSPDETFRMNCTTVNFFLGESGRALLKAGWVKNNKGFTIDFLNKANYESIFFFQRSLHYCSEITSLADLEKIYYLRLEPADSPDDFYIKNQSYFSVIPELVFVAQSYRFNLETILNSFQDLASGNREEGMNMLRIIAKKGGGKLLTHCTHISDLIAINAKFDLEILCNQNATLLYELLINKFENLSNLVCGVDNLSFTFKILINCEEPDIILNSLDFSFLEKNPLLLKNLVTLVNRNWYFAAYLLQHAAQDELIKFLNNESESCLKFLQLDNFLLDELRNNKISVNSVFENIKTYFSIAKDPDSKIIIETIGFNFLMKCHYQTNLVNKRNILKIIRSSTFFTPKLPYKKYEERLRGFCETFALCYKKGEFDQQALTDLIQSKKIENLFFFKNQKIKPLPLSTYFVKQDKEVKSDDRAKKPFLNLQPH